MSKDNVGDWDTDANDNTDVGGNNIAEGCPPSSINNAIRTVMAQIKTWYENVPQLDADNDFSGENTFSGANTFSTAPTFSTPLPLTGGGTGATSASAARTALGLGALALLGFSDLVYTGSDASNATFPIATTLAVQGVTPNRNGLAGVWLPSANQTDFNDAGPVQLGGVWRGRGRISSACTLMQRTA
jgi:hypothetical protein